MIALLQRVTSAKVVVDNELIGEITEGLLVLIGVERTDDKKNATRLVERLLNYRIFADNHNKMNLSLRDTEGGVLFVPQFTLIADTKKGTRPGFSHAAAPQDAKHLFLYCVSHAQKLHGNVSQGIFGADMKVSLTNDGPVTFWLQS